MFIYNCLIEELAKYIFSKVVITLRLRYSIKIVLLALIFIAFTSSLLVFCINWARHRLQSTV